MKNYKSLLLVLLSLTLCFSSCKNDEEVTDSYLILTEHLLDIDMDLNHVIKNAADQKFVMGAPADGDVSGKSVMDIRSATDFAAGHIAGATNVAFADILTAAASATKPILVVCYTGQNACYATSLLRLAGYQDAQALKWGMSGWNAMYDKWTPNIGNEADGHANWHFGSAPENSTKGTPELTTMASEGAAILAERVAAVVAEGGLKGVNGTDVLNSPSDYYINNYFSATDYTTFGHITSAYRVQPLLISDGSIQTLDPSAKVVTYCYTGQTSAVITAFLRVLGYDAYSLKFGMNGLFNSSSAWSTNQWGGDSNPKSLDTVTD